MTQIKHSTRAQFELGTLTNTQITDIKNDSADRLVTADCIALSNVSPTSSDYLPSGEYISPAIDLSTIKHPYKLELTASIPHAHRDPPVFVTSIRIRLRSADTLSALSSAQWYGPTSTTDYYDYRILPRIKEWPINSVHANNRYIQYKILFSTTDIGYSPLLYDIRIDYGNSISDIRSIELSSPSRGMSYAFNPGEVIDFKVEVIEYTTTSNIVQVNLTIYDPTGNIILNTPLSSYTNIDSYRRKYTYSYVLPASSTIGLYTSLITIINTTGLVNAFYKASMFKVRDDYTTPARSFKLGILEEYGLIGVGDPAVKDRIINQFKKWTGFDIWKGSMTWKYLMPKRGEFNPDAISFINDWMYAAQTAGAKVQFGIRQQAWGGWVNDTGTSRMSSPDAEDTGRNDQRRPIYQVTKYLAETWAAFAILFKDHPAFDSYLIINEEVNPRDHQAYIKSTGAIVSAIRSVDNIRDENNQYKHRIAIRSEYTPINSFRRTQIDSNGNHDINYGTGLYPTSSNWNFPHFESPVSFTSFYNLSANRTRISPVAFNLKAGIGEIGFGRKAADTFGDREKVDAFKRIMSIAYDQGFEDFMIWGGSFSLNDPAKYVPELKAFRDYLVSKPRITNFNVRVLNDVDTWGLVRTAPSWETYPYRLDKDREPYYYLVRSLDENGFSWFFTHQDASPIQPNNYQTTIKLSEIRNIIDDPGKSADQKLLDQCTLLKDRLKNISPNGTKYPFSLVDPTGRYCSIKKKVL